MSETTLTADGTFEIQNFPAETALVKLSGTFGGGTSTISVSEGARGTDLVLDTATATYLKEVVVGVGNDLKIEHAGSGGSFSLLIQVIPVRS